MATHPYIPDDIFEELTLHKASSIYLPYYWFWGSFDSNYSVSVGYDRQETYTEYENRYENGRTRRVAVEKTRTVTDWHPFSGRETGKFSVLPSASDVLPDDFKDMTEKGFVINDDMLKKYSPIYANGFSIHPFAYSSDITYDKRGKKLINEVIEKRITASLPGDRYQDLSWSSNISREYCSVYYPAIISRFDYKDEEYLCVMNGVNKKLYWQIPKATGREVATTVLDKLPLLTLAGAVILFFFMIFTDNLPDSLIAYFVISVVAVIVAKIIGQASKESLIENSRQRRLQQMQAFINKNDQESVEQEKKRGFETEKSGSTDSNKKNIGSKLKVRGYEGFYAVNPPIEIYINNKMVYELPKGKSVELDVEAGATVEFRCSFRKKTFIPTKGHYQVIQLDFNSLTGSLIAKVVKDTLL